MLTFLRKHQKVFFIIVSVVTIASFLFFGTFDTLDTASPKKADREAGKAIDGSVIKESDLKAMSHFLSSEAGSFVQNDLLSTGLAALLAEKYFDRIKDDFAMRLEKAKKYRPYVHPQAPFISAESAWERFTPDLVRRMGDLKQAETTPEAFSLFCRLYLDQAAFPPDVLARILAYQQRQYDWIQPDPSLHPSRVSLFGYQNIEEWFGLEFLEIVCRFLIDSAKVAEEKGYSISSDEARAGLLQNALQTLQARDPRKDYTYQDASDFFRRQILSSGIDESSAIKIWKRVLLFRRLFDGVGKGMVVDPLTYEKFAAYAGEKATIELYQLPEPLRFRDVRTALKFQLYLNAVLAKNKNSAVLSLQFLSPSDVQKNWPELVQTRFYLETASVSQEALCQRVSLKETWDWEKREENWQELKKEFPILGLKDAATDEERLAALDRLDAPLRLKIDNKARLAITKAHPEWVQEALAHAKVEKLWVGIPLKGAVHPFEDISEPAELIRQLQEAQIGEAKVYTFSGKQTLYQITVLEKGRGAEIMPFADAMKEEILGKLLDRELEEAYVSVRKKDPALFQNEQGTFKPLEDVKDQVGLRHFAAAFKRGEKESLEEAALHRLKSYAAAAFESVKQAGDASPYLQEQGDLLKDQFRLVKSVVDIKRSDASLRREALSLHEGDWSLLQTPFSGDISFFRVTKKQENSEPIEDQIALGQQILSSDAKRFLLHQILDRIGAL